jgi:hypothetical protein
MRRAGDEEWIRNTKLCSKIFILFFFFFYILGDVVLSAGFKLIRLWTGSYCVIRNTSYHILYKRIHGIGKISIIYLPFWFLNHFISCNNDVIVCNLSDFTDIFLFVRVRICSLIFSVSDPILFDFEVNIQSGLHFPVVSWWLLILEWKHPILNNILYSNVNITQALPSSS